MAISIDGETLTITLPATVGGVLDIDAEIDLYSEWKKWSLLVDNLKYEKAFDTSAGDPLTTTLDSGGYFFLRNDLGWRLKPYEGDGDYYFTGNLIPRDSTIRMLTSTVGGYTVGIFGLQPVTQTVETSVNVVTGTALTAQEVEDAVWDAAIADHEDAGSTGEALANDENSYAI